MVILTNGLRFTLTLTHLHLCELASARRIIIQCEAHRGEARKQIKVCINYGTYFLMFCWMKSFNFHSFFGFFLHLISCYSLFSSISHLFSINVQKPQLFGFPSAWGKSFKGYWNVKYLLQQRIIWYWKLKLNEKLFQKISSSSKIEIYLISLWYLLPRGTWPVSDGLGLYICK